MIEYPLRLQLYMAKCGVGSRRFCEQLILTGRVMVNNKVVKELGFKVESGEDVVQLDGETIEIIDKEYYIALNKPRGYLCTNYDPNEKLYARDLIDMRDRNLLFNIGRLDRDSNGLLLFTNDGDFANAVMHPKFEIEKEYLVHLDRKCETQDLREAVKGLRIDDEKPYRIKKYEFIPRNKEYIKVVLTEGRNREIRKIFSYLDYEVKGLTRLRIGPVELGDLKSGTYRYLSRKEIDGLLEGKNSLEPKRERRRRDNKDRKNGSGD